MRDTAVEAGISGTYLDEIFLDVRTVSEGRRRVFDVLAAQSKQVITEPSCLDLPFVPDGGNRSRSNHGGVSEQIVAELTTRLGGREPEGSRPFAGMRMVEIGRRFFEAGGVAVRHLNDATVAEMMLSGETVRGFHTTSDFPSLLIDGGQRALEQRFNSYATPLKQFSREREVKDFRPASFIRPGEAPVLEPITESGEITFGTFQVEEGGIFVKPFGKGIKISRQAIINDDLGAFADQTMAFADMSVHREAIEFFVILKANSFAGAVMKDGLPMFHTDRKNKAAAGSALSVTSVSEARAAMRLHKNVNGAGLAGTTPAVILVGPKLETAAEQLVSSLTASKSSDVNPFAGKLRVEVENQYDGTGWWLLADPKTRPAFTHAYLNGQSAPRIRIEEPFGVQGIGFTCEFDFGCAPYDWRAAYFNPGA